MKDGDFVICNNFDAFKFKSVTLTNNTFYEEYKLDGLTIGKKYELLAYIDFSDTVVRIPSDVQKSECGGNGRHARFRFWCLMVCGFESRHSYKNGRVLKQEMFYWQIIKIIINTILF